MVRNSARLSIIMILGALLCLGGLLEYVVMAYVHNSYGQWRLPDEVAAPSDFPKKASLSGMQGDAPYRKYLEAIGKEKMQALQAKVPAAGQDKSEEQKENFYDRRDNLLDKLDRRLADLGVLHSKLRASKNSAGNVNADAKEDESDYAGSRHIDSRIRYIHFDHLEEHILQQVDEVTESPFGPEVLVENDSSLVGRTLSRAEATGNNILLTLRTIRKYHDKRLPLLFDTWLSKVNKSNVFLMTDDRDPAWQRRVWRDGMHYVLTSCNSYTARESMLCCRTGTEMAQIFKRGNEHYDWLCHIDDDMYVHLPPLIQLLSYFDPKKDSVYLGRSGSEWAKPRKVLKEATLGREGQGYHFAVGGMYCLSRAMLELAKPYLVGGRNFSRTCAQTLEPDDVTIGLVVDIMLNKTLSRTEKIYTHGLHLISTVEPSTLAQQVAFSYGFGSFHWGLDDYNAIYVPQALYSIEEDESQFRSLHCHLYPEEARCIQRALQFPRDDGLVIHNDNNQENLHQTDTKLQL